MTYYEIIQKAGRKIKPIVYYFDSNNEKIEISRDNFVKARLFFNAKILGTVMKGVELELKEKLSDTAIYIDVIASYGNNSAIETYGPYYFKESPTYNADVKTYTHYLYDQFIVTMIDYHSIDIEYPCTVFAFFSKLIQTLNFDTDILELPNGSRFMNSDIYDGIGYTYRDVLEDIGHATGTLFEVENTTIKKLNFNSSDNVAYVNDDILKNKNINFGEQFGPINTIVLSRSADSDYIFKEDEELVLKNGRKEIKILDNQLMNNNDREDYLDELLQRLKEIKFSIFDTELVGYGGFIPLQPIRFETNNNVYDSFVFNNEIEITQGYTEIIYTEMPSESVTNYQASDSSDRRIKQAYIIVNKQNKIIQSLVGEVTDLGDIVDANGKQIIALGTQITQNQESVQASITQILDSLKNGVETVKNTLVTIDVNGIKVATNLSKISTLMTNDTFAIQTNTGTYLAYFGYDEEEGRSKAEMDNLTVTNYLTAGYHRQEKFEPDGEKRTGWFYVGGDI